MKTLGNIIWFLLGGFVAAILWYIAGIILCLTIIGIPFAKVCFRLGNLVLWPFGKVVKTDFDQHPIANIIWLIIAGWEMAIGYVTVGLIFCLTIVGIPFGKQWFKMAKVALLPFGSTIK